MMNISQNQLDDITGSEGMSHDNGNEVSRYHSGTAPRWLWQGRVGPAFWTVASLLSLAVNITLIVMLLVLARHIFTLKNILSQQLVDGLYLNFVAMDEARITTTIQVDDTIPVQFDLPVVAATNVRLTENVRIKGAKVNLQTGGLAISNAPATIILPAGTKLPISLDFLVPVNTTVPVHLTVPVDIPLNQTELHTPFVGLQEVVSPYNSMLAPLPNSWQATPLCASSAGWLCNVLLADEE